MNKIQKEKKGRPINTIDPFETSQSNVDVNENSNSLSILTEFTMDPKVPLAPEF